MPSIVFGNLKHRVVAGQRWRLRYHLWLCNKALTLQAVRQEHLLLQQTHTPPRQQWLLIIGLLGFTLLLWRIERFSTAAPSDPPLLRVRTRWEAEESECIQRIQGRAITLSVIWLDRGQAEAKHLHIWSLADHTQPLITCDVAVEAQQVEVKASATSLPPGAYLLQIVAVDPWATTDPVRPRQTTGAPSCGRGQRAGTGSRSAHCPL